jgi:CDP-diacylglycerol--serine O-phosphatidyltransferase
VDEPCPPAPRRHRRLVILPTLVTLGNLAAGFLAINYVTDYVRDVTAAGLVQDPAMRDTLLARGGDRLALAAWLIFLGMVFDALDGYVARLTRQQSDFGVELDSICDVVTFGIAPAILAKSFIVVELAAHGATGHSLARDRFAWAFAVIYAICAASRLARFNVDTDEEDSHTEFLGLPSPAAAAVIAGLVIFYKALTENQIVGESEGATWVLHITRIMLLVAGMAMVSRLRYLHFVNTFLARRIRARNLVLFASPFLLMLLIAPEFVVPIGAFLYFLSGPYWTLRQWWRERRLPAHAPSDLAAPLGGD